jgi:hypothetical protein
LAVRRAGSFIVIDLEAGLTGKEISPNFDIVAPQVKWGVTAV